MTRAVTPSVQADAETRSESDSCDAQSPAASLSSIRRSAVVASGTRKSASASTMRASPSLVDERIGMEEVLDAAQARRTAHECLRSTGSPRHRCAHRRRADGRLRRTVGPLSPHRAARRAHERPLRPVHPRPGELAYLQTHRRSCVLCPCVRDLSLNGRWMLPRATKKCSDGQGLVPSGVRNCVKVWPEPPYRLALCIVMFFISVISH